MLKNRKITDHRYTSITFHSKKKKFAEMIGNIILAGAVCTVCVFKKDIPHREKKAKIKPHLMEAFCQANILHSHVAY